MIPISIENLRFSYSSRTGDAGHDILAGVTLQIPKGQTLGIIGPNGSGKSTLLRCICRTLKPYCGSIKVLDQDVNTYSTKALASKVGVVSQQEEASIPLTIKNYVLLGRSPHIPTWKTYSDQDRLIAKEAMIKTGILEMQDRSILELSGGEQKRAMFARALAQQTPILLLDEPTNHLDVYYQHQVLNIVKQLAQTCAVVLHDLNLAARYCDCLALLDHGKIVNIGTVEEVLTPEILEPIYGVRVHTMEIDGVFQLLMSPNTEHTLPH
ncbi:ABC transporter ATP-binding protein [Mobiluncus mulieris]|uniref:ABC transporter ATP-binding protein n=1 Tax=Mobiluncus mulieris TaxID=2052 RepID=UPI00147079A7|nr:ABC transporter ATP-binding protein [Mobiluncus mulieris]MCV0009853.1 ABC transporter ATP-binding protein [Mobiluncus mulieris]NMX02173.1 ABC transporter ATP-binding protein [Mobiluncus mulieris]NMX20653.1 ABC transporter ATP-binding protein [Mobiluncus mulieris]